MERSKLGPQPRFSGGDAPWMPRARTPGARRDGARLEVEGLGGWIHLQDKNVPVSAGAVARRVKKGLTQSGDEAKRAVGSVPLRLQPPTHECVRQVLFYWRGWGSSGDEKRSRRYARRGRFFGNPVRRGCRHPPRASSARSRNDPPPSAFGLVFRGAGLRPICAATALPGREASRTGDDRRPCEPRRPGCAAP
jgi:hypothetical protein